MNNLFGQKGFLTYLEAWNNGKVFLAECLGRKGKVLLSRYRSRSPKGKRKDERRGTVMNFKIKIGSD